MAQRSAPPLILLTRKSRRKERARSRPAAEEPRPLSVPAPQLQNALIIGGLLVLVFAIYAQVRTHAFIDFDDPGYVSNNPHVLGGLTWSGVQWAFTHVYQANWHPLTWISHMIDAQLFGPNAGAHLLVSVALHALNSALLFLLLYIATGAQWRSAVVAALFAVHPMHVESVAWVSERKDTLSTLFFFSCLGCYAFYVKKHSRVAYGLSIAALAVGLLAKPMLVTTPFVLLLLDFWPFGRLDRATIRQRAIEKVPFALCIVPSIFATLFAQREAMPNITTVPLLLRFANAAIAYVKYVAKTVWPSNLSVIYPFPSRISPSQAAICALLVLAASVFAFRLRRTLPWLFVGWFWFVGTLVPVIGIVQVGVQSMADRYMYISQIGLFIAIVWTAAWLRIPRMALPLLATVTVVIFSIVTYAQVRYWSGSIPLFEHALAVTANNKVAHFNLATGFWEAGMYQNAEREYRLAQGYKPADSVYIGLALALLGQGKMDAAAGAASKAVQANRTNAEAYSVLGSVESARGHPLDAQRALARSLELKSDPAVAAQLSLTFGKVTDAINQFAEAIAAHPQDAGLHNNYAATLARSGDDQRALAEYESALSLNPNLFDAHMNYGALLSRLDRNEAAAQHFQDAARLRPRSPEPHIYLAVLEASQGRFDVAAKEAESSIAIDHDASNRLLINAIRIPARPTAIDEYLAFLRHQSGHR